MYRKKNTFVGIIGRFWFSPSDPTTLGFMRIITGLLVLYSTFAYSFDLKWLMGPDAISNQEIENQARRERSYVSFPISWNFLEPTVRLEDAPHRRSAVLEFMKGLPTPVEERRQKLSFLARVFGMSYVYQQECFFLPNSAARLTAEAQVEQVNKALRSDDPKTTECPVTFPGFVWQMPVAERLKFWQEIRDFTDLLPADPYQQEYVLSWLSYYPFEYRKDLLRFLGGDFVDDSGKQLGLPADPEVRGEFLRYIEMWGLDPRQHEMKNTPIFSPYFHMQNLTTMWFFHTSVMVLSLLFAVGLYTRVVSVMLYLSSLAYIHRASAHMFGQDTMQTILLLYLMISPCGSALSLDAIRARYRATRAIISAGGASVPWAEKILNGPQPSWLANFVLRMFQVHFGVIYLIGGASKLKGNAWWNHNAGWMTMVNPDFGLVYYKYYENLMHWIADHRMLSLIISGSAVFFTIGLEISFIFLIWTRCRPVMLVWAFTFHTMIAMFMGLCVFALNMLTLMLCYFPAKLIRERIGIKRGVGPKLTVRYDPSSSRQARTVAVIRAFDVADQVTLVPENAIAAVTMTFSDGKKLSGNGVLGESLAILSLTKPFAWILRELFGSRDENTNAQSLNVAGSMFFGGIGLSVCGVYSLILAYADNDGARPAIAISMTCLAAIFGGMLLKLAGLRSMLFKGAL